MWKMRNGSSIARAAVTLLMFPLGSVILVHMTPKGSGLVSNRGLKKKKKIKINMWGKQEGSCG